MLSREGCVAAIEEQQPLKTPEVSSCCLDAFLSRKKAERRGAELSQSSVLQNNSWEFTPRSAVLSLSAPRRPSLHLHRKLLLWMRARGYPPQNRMGVSQERASFLHLVKRKALNKAWGEWIHGKTLMEVKGVWKTLSLPVK